jgi:hypothetical protein
MNIYIYIYIYKQTNKKRILILNQIELEIAEKLKISKMYN